MANNIIVTRFEILYILMNLIEITGKTSYQHLFNGILGLSPEHIDKSILCERRNKELSF